MKTTNRRTQRAKTRFTSEELVAKGLAMKDSTGTYSELILLYEEPGAKGWGFCGKARLDAHGNEFPCLRKKGKKTVLVTDVSVVSEGGEYENVAHNPCAACYLDSVKEAEKKGRSRTNRGRRDTRRLRDPIGSAGAPILLDAVD